METAKIKKVVGFNNQIATEPFKTTEVKLKGNGFVVVEQKHALTPLKVVYGSDKIPAGATIYVVGESCKMPWAQRVFEANGTSFIMVPEVAVVLVETDEPQFTYNWTLNSELQPTYGTSTKPAQMELSEYSGVF